jgi:hypothetical protein
MTKCGTVLKKTGAAGLCSGRVHLLEHRETESGFSGFEARMTVRHVRAQFTAMVITAILTPPQQSYRMRHGAEKIAAGESSVQSGVVIGWSHFL